MNRSIWTVDTGLGTVHSKKTREATIRETNRKEFDMIELPEAKELENEFKALLKTPSDRAKFAIMISHLETAKEAARVLATDGPLTYDSRDLPAKHPAAALFRDHAKEFQKILDWFVINEQWA